MALTRPALLLLCLLLAAGCGQPLSTGSAVLEAWPQGTVSVRLDPADGLLVLETNLSGLEPVRGSDYRLVVATGPCRESSAPEAPEPVPALVPQVQDHVVAGATGVLSRAFDFNVAGAPPAPYSVDLWRVAGDAGAPAHLGCAAVTQPVVAPPGQTAWSGDFTAQAKGRSGSAYLLLDPATHRLHIRVVVTGLATGVELPARLAWGTCDYQEGRVFQDFGALTAGPRGNIVYATDLSTDYFNIPAGISVHAGDLCGDVLTQGVSVSREP
ncbi:MAG: hypothetical protein ACYDAY_08265 [Candidatus Dormibacteria bacterium]